MDQLSNAWDSRFDAEAKAEIILDIHDWLNAFAQV
jgi:hypothetical protein